MSTPVLRKRALAGLCVALLASLTAAGEPLDAIQLTREGGCGGLVPYAPPLHRSAALDRAAAAWSRGTSLKAAMFVSGYPIESSSGLHVFASEANLILVLRNSCRKITDPSVRDVGLYSRDKDSWFVLGSAGSEVEAPRPLEAARRATPEATAVATKARPVSAKRSNIQASLQAERILSLINAARAHATTCGDRTFAPAPPVNLSSALDGVAYGHALDMADHNYFEHEDLLGHSPADRVRAVGYKEKLVGENIAYGVENADQAVRGWLDSPGHCENIMDPRFAEMGIGFAQGRSARHGLYWVQLLAQPKA
ncbi:MAG TPA: CAP domain-containing protein [Steroidobacteraceae bacterium]|jgi:uncharacterized protein YkwD